ncbi:ATP-binding protein [Luteolibacter flavescens]|uniref:histidine kinase n=1 Tax=Luteolibacter flavescens TaxID=1859460 RepID=A0ABT3FK82_9BACT|nr:ATP-binding protein [Luteolibacter flavescens]MCW1883624.1 ATP-binding protein [Luteolibacter flavescens]
MSDSIPSSLPTPDTDDCAREPIHIPGSVQPHGVLFVLATERLEILQVSASAADLIGRDPAALAGTAFLEIVPPDARGPVERLVREAATTYVNPFRVPVAVGDEVRFFDGIVHILESGETVVELENDPAFPHQGHESTEGLDNYLQIVHRSLAQLSGVCNARDIAAVMAREVKTFTGFDRVMIYRFAADYHGVVIAEAVEPEMEPYMDLHYPASDIPPQARALYLKNPVRLLQDVHATPVPLVPALHPATGAPLDMSRAVLRSMSPIHVQYLKNMGVASSLSISLVVDGKLWGLIACHHRTPRFVSYAIRATACLYAIVMSAQLKAKQASLENLRMSSARRMALDLITGLKDYADPVGSLGETLPALRDLFKADGAAVLSLQGIRSEGSAPEDLELLSLRQQLEKHRDQGIVITHEASTLFPSLAEGLPRAAGLVAIHLGEHAWLVVFRDEAVKRVKWAGDPTNAKFRDESGVLSPRSSFAAWQETVRGQAMPWPDSTTVLTTEVRAGILELVRKRNILLERSNQDLRRFAGIIAHEVKNQLQSGMMALSLLEYKSESTAPEVAQLAGLASRSLGNLAKFTNDMLEFSETEMNSTIEDIDFAEMAREIVDQLHMSGRTEGAVIQIMSLPRIRGPKSQMHHLLSNLLRNALTHARSESKNLHIEIGARADETHGTVIYVRDDGRGIPSEKRDKIFEYFFSDRGGETKGTGIGLAFCAQVVQRLGHRMWVESEVQEGSTFYFSVSPADESPQQG